MTPEQELLSDLWKLLDRHKFQYKIELTVDNHSVTLVSSGKRKEEVNGRVLVKCTAIPIKNCSYPSCSCVQKLVSQLK